MERAAASSSNGDFYMLFVLFALVGLCLGPGLIGFTPSCQSFHDETLASTMAFRRLGVLALTCISTACAFQGTSPLFVFSTLKQLDSSFDSPLPPIASSSSVLPKIEELAGKCLYHNFVLVSQPGASSSDFADEQSAPHLKRWVVNKDDGVVSSLAVPELTGKIDPSSLSTLIKKKCGASVNQVDAADGYISLEGESPRIVRVEFPALPLNRAERATKLAEHDSFLNAVISSLHDSNFVVLYMTTPPSGRISDSAGNEQIQYQMDEQYPSITHGELKRDMKPRASDDNPDLPLFEKYMFLSPGIFMGLFAALPLLLILYVGITAVAGLEVSYFAFSKEMGPSAQKKQG